MAKIRLAIGETAGGKRFTLPAEAVTETFAILAKRGVGKTYTASVLVEELFKAGLHVCVADPIGVWWGLRASADGNGPGLPIVVLGGDHGDVALEVTAGEVIADLVAEERVSVVLDLSRFRKGEQTRFMTDFCERLYHKNRQPLHLVLDEADAFAPQRPMKGQERLLGAVEDLVRRGRARGLGITLVTQRAAVLNKDVLTQAEVLVSLRTIAPQDRDAIDAWIRVHGTPEEREALMSSLPSLPIGTAWFWSPGWLDVFERVEVRRRETFDSSATPKAGAKIQAPKRLADVDLDALRTRLAATIERTKADDPKELRRQIAALQRQIREQKPETRIETQIERVEVPVLTDDQVRQLAQAINQLAETGANLTLIAQELKEALARATATPALPPPAPPPVTRSAAPVARPVAPPPPAPSPTTEGPEVQLRPQAVKLLETLLRLHPRKLTRTQLAKLSGVSPKSSSYQADFSALKRAGFMDESGGELALTQAGFDDLGQVIPSAPQTSDEVIAMWREALAQTKGELRLFDELVAVYPQSLSRFELAQRAGVSEKSSSYQAHLGDLRRNGLIETQGDQVRASETLFLA